MNNAYFLALALLRAMERRETTLLSNAAYLAAIYVDLRHQVLLKYSQKNGWTCPLGSIVKALANAGGVNRHV